MAALFKDLEAQVLALPERERTVLAARLLDSLETTLDGSPESIAIAWDEEIARRVADFEAGRTEGIPYEQVRAEIGRRGPPGRVGPTPARRSPA